LNTADVKPEATLAGNPGESLGIDCGYKRLVSDIFHDLSQPLSTLTCLLEINLLLSRTPKQWRHDLKIALRQAHSIVRHFRALRELWEAGNAQSNQQKSSLTGCLREVVADLLPVAESTRVRLSLTCSSAISSSGCTVKFDASRLRQGLTHLLEFAIESCHAGAYVKITADEDDEGAQVRVAISAVEASGAEVPNGGKAVESGEWDARDLKRRQGLAVAWRIFESAGGRLQAESSGDQLWLELCLPWASCPPN
jgi:K+-sensing histidine kinase KdpD